MSLRNCPEIKVCCGCIPNLRTATAIIAVLAIVTNPTLSWLMVRHTYSMRVSCYLTAINRIDIVDLNINNMISFGFGVNADLGPSCLQSSTNTSSLNDDDDDTKSAKYAEKENATTNKLVIGLGWVVLVADIIFLIISLVFLVMIYRNPTARLAAAFMISCMIAVIVSTIYGILYVVVCATRGKGLALCELIMSFFDVALWAYFLMVVNCYSKKLRVNSDE